MAKYNAIYEGRLPHGICNGMIYDSAAVVHQGEVSGVLIFLRKAYKKFIDILRL